MLTTKPPMFSTGAGRVSLQSRVSVHDGLPDAGAPIPFHAASAAVRSAVPSIAAKLAAAVSLLLWTAVVAGGRTIAFI
jgi:hypothetical protein